MTGLRFELFSFEQRTPNHLMTWPFSYPPMFHHKPENPPKNSIIPKTEPQSRAKNESTLSKRARIWTHPLSYLFLCPVSLFFFSFFFVQSNIYMSIESPLAKLNPPCCGWAPKAKVPVWPSSFWGARPWISAPVSSSSSEKYFSIMLYAFI